MSILGKLLGGNEKKDEQRAKKIAHHKQKIENKKQKRKARAARRGYKPTDEKQESEK